MEEEKRKGRLTTGWKVLIVLGLFTGGAGAGRGEQLAREARSQVEALRFEVRSLQSELSKIRMDTDALKRR